MEGKEAAPSAIEKRQNQAPKLGILVLPEVENCNFLPVNQSY
jgi:hypothetical protein